MIELLGAVVFGTYFLKYFPTWQGAYLQGFFASVAATTNAGFDITGKSLIPFANDYFVLTLSIVLFIIGSLGFPVLLEVSQWLRHKEKMPFRFSLFTKITTITFFILIVIGVIFILIRLSIVIPIQKRLGFNPLSILCFIRYLRGLAEWQLATSTNFQYLPFYC